MTTVTTVTTIETTATQDFRAAIKQRSEEFQRLYFLIVDLTGKAVKDSVAKIDWRSIKESIAQAVLPLDDEQILEQACNVSGLSAELVWLKAEINYLYALKEIQARNKEWNSVYAIKKDIVQLNNKFQTLSTAS